MKHSTIKGTLIVLAFFALYGVTLDLAPAAQAAGGPDTSKIEPALLQAMQANPTGEFDVILETARPSLRDIPDLKEFNNQRSAWAAERIRANGGKKLNTLAIIGGAAATLNADAILNLSSDPFVRYIRLDRKLVPLSGTWGDLGNLD